jgi:hypothetical protein
VPPTAPTVRPKGKHGGVLGSSALTVLRGFHPASTRRTTMCRTLVGSSSLFRSRRRIFHVSELAVLSSWAVAEAEHDRTRERVLDMLMPFAGHVAVDA